MTDGENQRLGTYVETSAGGERVRAYSMTWTQNSGGSGAEAAANLAC